MTAQNAQTNPLPYYMYAPVPKAPPVDTVRRCAVEAMTDYDKKAVPWQYYGYPALSEWMASSNDFFVLRRFSPLQVRCLLYLQNEIAMKERDLQDWDMAAKCQDKAKGDSGDIGKDPNTLPGNPRPSLLSEIVPLLQQYNDLVLSFSNLKAKTTATDRQTQNVNNWAINNGPSPIREQQEHWKDHQGDLITMVTRPEYPLVGLLSRSYYIRRIFTLKWRKDRIKSDSTFYTSNRGLEIFAAGLCLATGLSMTFGSIWWLNYVSNRVHQLAIITASGGLLTALAWVAAGNRPFEILATFAAYMAVLMIYLQIDKQ